MINTQLKLEILNKLKKEFIFIYEKPLSDGILFQTFEYNKHFFIICIDSLNNIIKINYSVKTPQNIVGEITLKIHEILLLHDLNIIFDVYFIKYDKNKNVDIVFGEDATIEYFAQQLEPYLEQYKIALDQEQFLKMLSKENMYLC